MNRFDKEAREWDRNRRRVEVAKAVADFAIKCGVKGEILDFGCGTGLVSQHLKDAATKLTGFDTSQNMVEEYDKKFPGCGLTAYPDRKFDAVVTSMTLHHIKDLQALAKRLYDSLKSGGILVVADLYKEDGGFHQRGNDGVYHFGFYPNELQNLFEKAGFKKMEDKRVYTVKKEDKSYPIIALAFQK